MFKSRFMVNNRRGRPSRAIAVAIALAGIAVTVPATTAPASAATSSYRALTPQRLLDTRQDVGAPGPIGAGGSITLDVTGVAGVPASGVAAVVLNVTAVEATDNTYITVWPTGQPKPDTSNLNVRPGTDTPNLVIATVGTDGTVSLANQFGTVNLLADVAGWFPTGPGYSALTPQRVLDTRVDKGAPGPVGAGGSITLDVTGVAGVPAGGVAAVVLNVTAVEATDNTYITVWPTGQPKPDTSNLNVRPGTDTPNLVIATVGTDGTVSLANQFGTVNLLADVAGWFPTGSGYEALTPARVLDTRQGLGATGPLAEGASIVVDVTGAAGVPPAGVSAVVLNVTAAESTSNTYVTVWPTGQPRPGTSNLNVQPGIDTPNLVIATVSADGTVSLANQFGTTHLIADIAGYFTGTPPPQPGITGSLYYPYFGPLMSFGFADGIEQEVIDGSDRDTDGHLWQGYGVSWGGREAAYQILRPTFEVPRVHIRDLHTGALVTGFDVGCGGCTEFRAELSPDGQLIAIDTSNIDDPLHIYNRQGQLLRSFTGVVDATWAPDGTLVFVGQPIAGRYMMGRFLDVANSTSFELIFEYDTATVPYDDLPTWMAVSPDNTEVAYTYLGDLWVQPTDGSPARKVADAPTNHLRGAAFSPDSQHLAFHLHDLGPIQVVPAHPPAPVVVADGGEGPTAVRDRNGTLLDAAGQMHWLP